MFVRCSSCLHLLVDANISQGFVLIITQALEDVQILSVLYCNSELTAHARTHAHSHRRFYVVTAVAIACPLTPERWVGNILNILWSSGTPPLSSPPSDLLDRHTHTHTERGRERREETENNVLNAIIVRPKQCHLSREHLGLYNKFHIINTIFHPLSSLSDLWHACDLRWSLNYNFSNKRKRMDLVFYFCPVERAVSHAPRRTRTGFWINTLQLE